MTFSHPRVLLLGLFCATLGLAGCGGSDDDDTPPTQNSTINGVAMAGPIAGQVCAFPVSSTGGVGTASLGCANTNPATGAYTLEINDYTGVVLLTVSGTYIDETTGLTVTIPSNSPLRSLTNLMDDEPIRNVAITPLTEIAIQAALASGGLVESPVLAAFNNLATALGLNPGAGGNGNGFELLVQTLPTLSGTNAAGRAYGSLLDLTSFAQSVWCGGNTNCNLFDYLNTVSGYLATQPGLATLAQSMQDAHAQWKASQANNDYICDYTSGVFTCSPNANTGGGNTGGGNTGGGNTGGGNTGGGVITGNYNLNLVVTAMGVSTPIQITEVPKPNTQDEFCGEALALAQGGVEIPGGSWTMNSCNFDGTNGTITATVSITTPVAISVPYSVTYSYVAR